MPKRFGNEERVPVCAPVQKRDELSVRVTAQCADICGGLIYAESSQANDGTSRRLHESCERIFDGGRACKVVRATTRDDEHALTCALSSKEREEERTRGIGPVKVVNDQHDRLLGRASLQPSPQRLEQSKPRHVRGPPRVGALSDHSARVRAAAPRPCRGLGPVPKRTWSSIVARHPHVRSATTARTAEPRPARDTGPRGPGIQIRASLRAARRVWFSRFPVGPTRPRRARFRS